MLIIDSNHQRALRIPGKQSTRLKAKLEADGRAVVTTIINVYESIKGYFANINAASDTAGRRLAFSNLQDILDYYCDWIVLPFDEAAAIQFDILKKDSACKTVGQMDLQIAAIALSLDATVLTQNIKDFGRVPNLKVEDWLLDDPSDEAPYSEQS